MVDNQDEQIIVDNAEDLRRRKQFQPTKRLSLGATIGFVVSISLVYFLLLGPHHTVFSLRPLLHLIEAKLSTHHRALFIGLMPEYITLLILCIGIVGGVIGHFSYRYLFKKKS